MEPESWTLCLQELPSGPYPNLIQSDDSSSPSTILRSFPILPSHLYLGLPSYLFLSDIRANIFPRFRMTTDAVFGFYIEIIDHFKTELVITLNYKDTINSGETYCSHLQHRMICEARNQFSLVSPFAGLFLGLFFNPEYGGIRFLRNVGISPTWLYKREGPVLERNKL